MTPPSEPSISPSDDPIRHGMTRALELARLAIGRVEPNPMVGCVITDGSTILAEGYHQQFGHAHAEINALRQAHERGINLRDKTLIVTLEPCSHHGKTPPCADAVIASGIRRVVIAMQDPFDQVAGRGIAKLCEAGIDVEVGLMQAQARELNCAWLKRLETGLPWVTLKWAQTLDGRIATRTGDSQWISGDASRHRVHQLRAISDAIMVGAATAATDDPSLTARDVEVRREARKVVIDPTLRLTDRAKIMNEPTRVTLAISEQAASDPDTADRKREFQQRGVEIVVLPLNETGSLRLLPLLKHLVDKHDATRILVEGGGILHGHLLQQQLADELLVFVAPKLLGDPEARPSLAGTVVDVMDHAQRLNLLDIERIGDDVMLGYRVGQR